MVPSKPNKGLMLPMGIQDRQIFAQIGSGGGLGLNDQFVFEIGQFPLHDHKPADLPTAASVGPDG